MEWRVRKMFLIGRSGDTGPDGPGVVEEVDGLPVDDQVQSWSVFLFHGGHLGAFRKACLLLLCVSHAEL